MRKRIEHLAYFGDLYRNAHKQISRRECMDLVLRTADDMAATMQGERAVFAWSGGKDSVVLHYLMQLVGVFEGVCVATQLEYPCADAFMQREKPEGVFLIRTGHDLDWLLRNPRMLFPTEPRAKAEWYRQVQHYHTDAFAASANATMLVFGRRTEDGNVMRGKVYEVRGRAKRYNPLKDFTHLQVWGIMRHFGLPEYPLYALHPTSLVTGTGAWAQEPNWGIVKATDPLLYSRVRKYFANG